MEAKTVKPLLDKYGIKATLHFYDEADLGSYPEVVDAYLVLLERYCKLGEGYIESMNIHLCPGPVVTISGVKNYIYEKEYDEYIERFKQRGNGQEFIDRRVKEFPSLVKLFDSADGYERLGPVAKG